MALGTRRIPCSINDLHGAQHAKGLCFSCYMKDKRGTLNIEQERKVGKPTDIEITIPDALKTKGVSVRARYLIEQFVYHPKRVAAIVQHFYERALKNDKVLTEYVKILAPHRDATSPVQVIINAPMLSRESKVVYDVTGEQVKSAKQAVDVPEVQDAIIVTSAPDEEVHKV